ncbi:MAG: hypothetical protein ABWY93_10730 [Mycobacterium sp.]
MALTLFVAGCGSGGQASAPGTATPAPQRLVVEVAIADGNVTPTNATLQAKVGEPITLQVNSDVADELHVHSVPDHEFEVQPKSGQSFEFTVSVPGSVDVELHHLNRTVATIQVQP